MVLKTPRQQKEIKMPPEVKSNVAKFEDGKSKRAHKATYAVDKRKGGYIIRVEGPNSNCFTARRVPVTTKSGDEHSELLMRVIWTGKDKETGAKVTLYDFDNKPLDTDDITF